MPRAATQERRQQVHDALVAAAEKAIGKGGVPAIRARDLAEEVGCAVGAIYNVFPDLDALILEVNGRTLAEIGALVAKADRKAAGVGAEARLDQLAQAYAGFAASHLQRWRALFEHRMAGGKPVPDWYLERQRELFASVEEPVAELCPKLDAKAVALLARTLFSAVHGLVSLGLDEKLMPMPREVLRQQTSVLIETIVAGLLARDGKRKKR